MSTELEWMEPGAPNYSCLIIFAIVDPISFVSEALLNDSKLEIVLFCSVGLLSFSSHPVILGCCLINKW